MPILGAEIMNLAELLTYADIGQIHKIIDSYQCQCDRHSKTEMIQQLIFTVFNNKNLQNFFLESPEAVACRYILH